MEDNLHSPPRDGVRNHSFKEMVVGKLFRKNNSHQFTFFYESVGILFEGIYTLGSVVSLRSTFCYFIENYLGDPGAP